MPGRPASQDSEDHEQGPCHHREQCLGHQQTSITCSVNREAVTHPLTVEHRKASELETRNLGKQKPTVYRGQSQPKQGQSQPNQAQPHWLCKPSLIVYPCGTDTDLHGEQQDIRVGRDGAIGNLWGLTSGATSSRKPGGLSVPSLNSHSQEASSPEPVGGAGIQEQPWVLSDGEMFPIR